jgi:feruloyl esterase
VEMTRAVERGYAAASTDGGHKASDRHWLLGGPMRAANYAWRANHRLAEEVKPWVAKIYGRSLEHAFFVGCSGGGRQALTEVQRFPQDYDGVIAGAPGPKTPEMSARRLWEMIQHTDHPGLMSDADWKHVTDAQVAQCDALDGVRDGVIDAPQTCRFDWSRLQCGPSAAAPCLSGEQIALARRIYAPLVDESGHRIDDGLWPGVQVHAAPVPEPFTPGPAYLAVVLFADGVHHDPNWDPRRLRLDEDLPGIDKVADLHADDPDLRPFAARGGKLILFQGLADPLVAPQPTISYYRSVEAKVGGSAKAHGFVRLFLVPGMEHCLGGAGVDRFGQSAGQDGLGRDPEHDLLSALEAWDERGRAPDRIIADRLDDGHVSRTRPLCAYPQQAVYDGHGDPDRASSFSCRVTRTPFLEKGR